jgi:uncharacterized protein (DUF2141 family)
MLKRTVRRLRVTVVSLLATVAGTAAADPPQPPPADAGVAKLDLVVHVTGFKHGRGHAIAKLFLPNDNLLGPGQASARADIRGSESTITFPSLPAGPYAVIVVHDENDNGVCDHGLFGPTEPIGFSNGFHRGLFSFPTFEKLKFFLAPNRNRIEVAVR